VPSNRLPGMAGFSVVWFGQVVSVFGTGMTQFALTIWAWQVTGRATALALVGFCGFFPLVVMTPLAGSGPGSGMGLMFVLFGLLGTLAAVAGYLYRPVRDIETILPDAVPDQPVRPATQATRAPAQ